MSDEATLTCLTEDPTDAVARILMLLARCSIRIVSIGVIRECGAVFVAQIRLERPLPITEENLVDRVRQIPAVGAAWCCPAAGADTGASDQCSFRYMSYRTRGDSVAISS